VTGDLSLGIGANQGADQMMVYEKLNRIHTLTIGPKRAGGRGGPPLRIDPTEKRERGGRSRPVTPSRLKNGGPGHNDAFGPHFQELSTAIPLPGKLPEKGFNPSMRQPKYVNSWEHLAPYPNRLHFFSRVRALPKSQATGLIVL
jgi:hypothetical protein